MTVPSLTAALDWRALEAGGTAGQVRASRASTGVFGDELQVGIRWTADRLRVRKCWLYSYLQLVGNEDVIQEKAL